MISPFTPLFFNIPKSDGLESEYIQTFAPSDKILVQLIKRPEEDEGDWILCKEPGHVPFSDVIYNVWEMNSVTALDFAALSPSPGLYSLKIGGTYSQAFRVTDDPLILENTTLIQYSMVNNRQRDDAVFFIDHMQYFFDFRAPGGFKDSNWAFGIESEQFTTDKADIVQLYALDSLQQKFTLGNSQGCPVWFAALLNRILCCSYVYFNGVRYARKETSTPEMNVQLEGVNSFVFTQNLQRVVNLNPTIEQRNHLTMRRTDTDYRNISTNNYRKIL